MNSLPFTSITKLFFFFFIWNDFLSLSSVTKLLVNGPKKCDLKWMNRQCCITFLISHKDINRRWIVLFPKRKKKNWKPEKNLRNNDHEKCSKYFFVLVSWFEKWCQNNWLTTVKVNRQYNMNARWILKCCQKWSLRLSSF